MNYIEPSSKTDSCYKIKIKKKLTHDFIVYISKNSRRIFLKESPVIIFVFL